MLCISVFPAEGQYGEAYDNHMFLARFFTEPEDKWLKHHFIQLALHSARKFKMDSGKRESEANLHMGQVYLEKGNTFTFLQYTTAIQSASLHSDSNFLPQFKFKSIRLHWIGI